MPEIDQMIGRRIASMRVASKMSQALLAAHMVDAGHGQWMQSTLSAVEIGTRRLLYTEAISLSRILQAPLESFAGAVPQGLEESESRRLRATIREAHSILGGAL